MKITLNAKSKFSNLLAVKILCLVCVAAAAAQDREQFSTPVLETKKRESTAQTNVVEQTSVTISGRVVSKAEISELTEREKALLERVEQLEREVKALREMHQQMDALKADLALIKKEAPQLNAVIEATAGNIPPDDQADPVLMKNAPSKSAVSQQISEEDRSVLGFFRETTVNFGIDGNYTHNFNRPYNRVNLLRAYDVSSDSFSLNQASVVIENAPNPERNRRYGFRLDLQYGQATETLQGNPNNELRPQTYRPVWQAYGTYVAPIGKGLTVDFGKWASSLGYETNYTKDNSNYSRSYFFNYLPYYHFGVRAAYPVTKKLTASYWLVNGAQQSEDFNNSKSQAILLTYKPTEKITLQGNYYAGREQRDQQIVAVPVAGTSNFTTERLIPRGRFHVLDAYGTFLLTKKLTLALEGDYVVNRVNRTDAPARIWGGAGYLRYQWTPKFALSGRTEYLSDKGGLFSGASQVLKEVTITGEYKFAEGFLIRGEYRNDLSNQPYFYTNQLDSLKKSQNTATIGVVWWFGRKQGAW